jgi:hypothetical protein
MDTPTLIIKHKYAEQKLNVIQSELQAKINMPVVPRSEIEPLMIAYNKQKTKVEQYEKVLNKNRVYEPINQ